MRRRLITPALAVAAVAATALGATAASGAPAHPRPGATRSHAQVLHHQLRTTGLSKSRYRAVDVCKIHHLACQAIALTRAKSNSASPMAFKPFVGYGATDLEKAYGLTKAPDHGGTIVVIGAGAYPTLASDLAIYRSTYHLPPCTVANGCFTQMNYKGGAPYKPAKKLRNQFGEEEIGVETSIDVDMASAACPDCNIVSMQVPLTDGFYGNKKHIHNAILHFATGVQTAAGMGASAVSISYGYPTDKYSDKGAIAAMMDQPGMPIVSSSGDAGFTARSGQWPQSLTTVTSAGGTSLYTSDAKRGYTEVAWNGAGSNCTTDLGPANGQPKAVSKLCHGHRAASDISAVADPYTGVSTYDSYAPATGEPLGFSVWGGTSVASPFLAGLYARAGNTSGVEGPNTLYADPASDFHDVTLGTNAGLGYCETVFIGNAVCDSGTGWDGPTGLGTPKGLAPFRGSST